MSASPAKSASTILEFCRRWGISRSAFYEWRNAGLAPRVIKIGPKLAVITTEDEAAWVAERREAADAGASR